MLTTTDQVQLSKRGTSCGHGGVKLGCTTATLSRLKICPHLLDDQPLNLIGWDMDALAHAGGFKAKFHVGDTPMDVLAAEDGGASAVGVLTGIYTQEELEKTGVGMPGSNARYSVVART